MKASALACFALLAGGCQSEPRTWEDDWSFVWHGEHVSVYGYERFEEEACGGSLAAVDAHTTAILEFFGEPEPEPYDYRWMSYEFWDPDRCAPGAGACTASGVPWTRALPDLHENAHGAMHAAWGNWCPSVLREGLAEYFSEPRRRDGGMPDPSTIRAALIDAPISFDYYNVAAHFTSFLIEEFGPEVIKDLCGSILYYNTLDDWDQAFEQHVGLGLDAVLGKYESYPLCSQQQYRARLGECEGEPDVIHAGNDEPTIFDVEVDCADKRMLGPVKGRAYTTRRLWVPEWTLAHVQVWKKDDPGSLSGIFMSQECVPCSASPEVHVSDGLPPIYAFNPGMHVITISTSLDKEVPYTVIMTPYP